jgi:hypothetical protein
MPAISRIMQPAPTMAIAAYLTAGALLGLVQPAKIRAAVPYYQERAHFVPEQMGPTWRDDADGFQLRLPDHFTGTGRHGMTLATYTYPLRHWGMTVHLSLMAHPIGLKKLARQTIALAKKDFQKVQVVKNVQLKVSGRPAAEIVVQFSAISNHAPIRLLRQQLIVKQTSQRFYVLTFFCPAADQSTTMPLFQRVIPTFRLLNKQKIALRRIEAIAAGRHWLKQQSVHHLLQRLNKLPHLYRVQIRHSDVGYVRLHAYAGHQDGFGGIFVTTNSRTFLPGGVVELGKSVNFWAFHHQPGAKAPRLDYSTFYDEAETVMPFRNKELAMLHDTRVVINPKTKKATLVRIPTPFPGKEVHWQTELGVEQSGFFPILSHAAHPTGQLVYRCLIHVSRQSDAVTVGQDNKPLIFSIGPGMPAVLPPVLSYLWPRLVNLKKPSRMAFVVFDTSTSHLGLNVLAMLGQKRVNINGVRKTTYEVMSRLNPFTTRMWVDSDGRIVKMANPDGSVWLPTTAAKMKAMWGHQLGQLR